MSYCRFDKDSDVYAYSQNNNVYVIHIANFRDDGSVFPYEGETFVAKGLKTFRFILISLRVEGLRIPEDCIKRIDKEMSTS